jgi:F0F1-type ATP synthase membrane subunit b/b'
MQVIDINIFYIVSFVSVALGLLLIGVLTMYLRLVRRHIKLKEKESQAKSGFTREAGEIIKEAEIRAQKIAEDAAVQAQRSVSQAQKFSQNQSEIFSQELQKATSIYLKEYKKAIVKSQEQSSEIVKNISNEVGKGMTKEIEVFRTIMHQQVGIAMQAAKNALESTYKLTQDQLSKHRDKRIEEIDEAVVKTVYQVAKKVMAKEINMDEHEKLVLKALEEAKRQNIF